MNYGEDMKEEEKLKERIGLLNELGDALRHITDEHILITRIDQGFTIDSTLCPNCLEMLVASSMSDENSPLRKPFQMIARIVERFEEFQQKGLTHDAYERFLKGDIEGMTDEQLNNFLEIKLKGTKSN